MKTRCKCRKESPARPGISSEFKCVHENLKHLLEVCENVTLRPLAASAEGNANSYMICNQGH